MHESKNICITEKFHFALLSFPITSSNPGFEHVWACLPANLILQTWAWFNTFGCHWLRPCEIGPGFSQVYSVLNDKLYILHVCTKNKQNHGANLAIKGTLQLLGGK